MEMVTVARLSKPIKLDQDSQLVLFCAVRNIRQQRPWRRAMQRPSFVPLLDQGPRAPAVPWQSWASLQVRAANELQSLLDSWASSSQGWWGPRRGHGGACRAGSAPGRGCSRWDNEGRRKKKGGVGKEEEKKQPRSRAVAENHTFQPLLMVSLCLSVGRQGVRSVWGEKLVPHGALWDRSPTLCSF